MAVSSIAERHVRRIRLRNGRECKMRRPRLNQDHVASNQAGRVCTASCIRPRVEDYCAVVIRGITEQVMEVDGKAVQMADVEGPEICVERVVKESVIDGEIDRAAFFAWACCLCSTLARRFRLGGVGKGGFRIRRVVIGGQVQSV